MLPYVQKTYKVGNDEYYALPVGVTGTEALTTGREYFLPIRIDNEITIKTIGVEATATAAGAIARVGLYKDAGLYFPRPGALIAEADATVSVAAAGFEEGAFATHVLRVSEAGLYWLAIVNQTAAATVRTLSGVELDARIPFGTAEPAAQSVAVGYYKAGVTGALGDVAVADTLVPVVEAPWLYFKVD